MFRVTLQVDVEGDEPEDAVLEAINVLAEEAENRDEWHYVLSCERIDEVHSS